MLVPGDPADRIELPPLLVVRKLLSPPFSFSLFFLNLAINPLKLDPELDGAGARETCGSTVTVTADVTDIDPLCSALEIEASPGCKRGL